jgi:hypothetical protein
MPYKDRETRNSYYRNRYSKERHEYYLNNVEKIREIRKQYYKENREKIIKRTVDYIMSKDNGLYLKYQKMISRCNSVKGKHYKNYAQRGIRCLWKSYLEFKNDMFDSFIDHKNIFGHRQTTLDRIDNDGNYCKENCRWATYQEQNTNKRK